MSSVIGIPAPSLPDEHESELGSNDQLTPEPAANYEVTTAKFHKLFEGKVALVTGIDSLYARNMARRFCVDGGVGVTIAYAPQDEAAARALEKKIMATVSAAKVLLELFPGDMDSQDACAGLIAAHMKTWGRLDFMALHYNTQPLRKGVDAGTITEQDARAAVDAGVQSFLELCKAATAHVREYADDCYVFIRLRDDRAPVGLAPLLDRTAAVRKINAFLRTLEAPPDSDSDRLYNTGTNIKTQATQSQMEQIATRYENQLVQPDFVSLAVSRSSAQPSRPELSVSYYNTHSAASHAPTRPKSPMKYLPSPFASFKIVSCGGTTVEPYVVFVLRAPTKPHGSMMFTLPYSARTSILHGRFPSECCKIKVVSHQHPCLEEEQKTRTQCTSTLEYSESNTIRTFSSCSFRSRLAGESTTHMSAATAAWQLARRKFGRGSAPSGSSARSDSGTVSEESMSYATPLTRLCVRAMSRWLLRARPGGGALAPARGRRHGRASLLELCKVAPQPREEVV